MTLELLDPTIRKGTILDQFSKLEDAWAVYRLGFSDDQEQIVDRLFDLIGLLKDAGWDVDMIKDIWLTGCATQKG